MLTQGCASCDATRTCAVVACLPLHYFYNAHLTWNYINSVLIQKETSRKQQDETLSSFYIPN